MNIHNFTVYDMFKRNARLFENATALVGVDERITFGELLKHIQSLSGSLSHQGVKQGDRIAILAQNSHKFFLIYGAAATIGAIVVPINWRLSVEEIQYILQDSAPTTIFIDEKYKNVISEIRAKCESLQRCFIFGGSGAEYISFNELMGDYPVQEAKVKGNDPYLMIYTAAVQGQPRGAILSHNNIIFCNVQAIGMFGLTLNDTYLNILPFFHVGGVSLPFSVMQAGGKNVIIPKFDPKVVLQKIDKERVTIMASFPPILTELLSEMSKGIYDLSSLKHVLGIDQQDIIIDFEKKTGSKFWLAYGQTETMGLSCFSPNSERPGSAGRQGFLVNIKLVDEYDREVEIGEKGEILVRGPLVFQGYWKQDELTRRTFRDGWHHTGDIGRLDKEGYLWFVGRKAEKELIKPGGENVYPAEVEKIILEHPFIEDVSVIGVPDKQWGEAIKAVCVLKKGKSLSESELIEFVASKIARYKKPKYVVFVSSMPKTKDGFTDREKVKANYG